jgi:rubrerythrin
MANEKRLIDANEIEELFYKQVECGATDLMDAFDDALQDAQTVYAVEVVHGRWIEKIYNFGAFEFAVYHCSECGKPHALKFNCCPSCGAKMDGDGNG